MQNTTRVQTVPTTLLKNFFIAGIDSTTLIQRIKQKRAYNIPPEVLFHLFDTREHASAYLQFVFPQNVTVEYKAQDPRFFSFMSTDAGGGNSFFHVLVFYEEVNEAEIEREDFDLVERVWKRQLEKEQQKKDKVAKLNQQLHMIKEVSNESSNNLVKTGSQEEEPPTPTPAKGENTIFKNERENLTRRVTRLQKRPILTANLLAKEREKTQLTETKEQESEESKDTMSMVQSQITRNTQSVFSPSGQQERKVPAPKTNEVLREKNQLSEMHKRGKDRDNMAKKYIQDIKLNLDKQCTKVIKQIKVERDRLMEPDGLLSNITNNLSTLVPQQVVPEGRYASSVVQGNFQSNQIPSQLPMLGKTSSYQSPQINARNLFKQNKTLAMEVEPQVHNAHLTPNFNLLQNHFAALPGQSRETSQVLADESSYMPNYNDVSRPSYSPTLAGVEPIKQQQPSAEPIDQKLLKEHENLLEQHFLIEKQFVQQQEPPQFLAPQSDSGDDQLSEGNNFDENLFIKKRYVPVAMILESETEYHDVFKQILLALFDLIRVPPEAYGSGIRVIENRNIAFADLIAHIAFLKTIPAPPFNTIYNIHMLPIIQQPGMPPPPPTAQSGGLHLFTIREGGFDDIPNRSLLPIKILFDVLDVRSIIYCWKALLFDKSLILVSSQLSLQFYVAEALKQLLFPMTWQNSYIQPGNDSLLGHADGFMAVIYGSNSSSQGFDYFDGMSNEMAVCDIDACFTNQIELPSLPSEHMYIRILNTLKNSKISCYDKAYPNYKPKSEGNPNTSISNQSNHTTNASENDIELFVTQIRETFFSLLKPYFCKIEDFIDKRVKSNGAFFENYFQINDYLSYFESMSDEHLTFAQALIKSSQFIHFCDEFFSDLSVGGSGDLTNFQMFKAIIQARSAGDQPANTEENQDRDFQTFRDLEMKTFKNLIKNNQGKGPSLRRPKWPDGQPVVVNFRMPGDAEKVMLFEKIHYMIENNLQKKQLEEQGSGRQTTTAMDKDIQQAMRYQELIADIRTAFFQGLSKCKFNLQPLSVQSGSSSNNGGGASVSSPKHQQNINSIQMANQGNRKVLQKDIPRRKHPAIERQNSMADDNESIVYVVERGASSSSMLMLTMQEYKLLHNQNPSVATPVNAQRRLPSPQGNQPSDNTSEFGAALASNQNAGNANINALLFEQEYRRVRFCHRRVSRLMYGRDGLIKFMYNLFGWFSPEEMKEAVNYYQQMRGQLEAMEHFEKVKRKELKERVQNIGSITEEQEHEEDDDGKTQMAFGADKKSIKRPRENSLHSAIRQSHVSSTNTPTSTFKSDRDWVAISDWYTSTDPLHCQRLRASTQYILFKTKLIEGFESCAYEGHTLVWRELFKFYPLYDQKAARIYPYGKFYEIWENLTYTQQEEWFVKYGQRQSTQQIQLITKEYMKVRHQTQSMGSTSVGGSTGASVKTLKADESVFRGASIKKTWLDKKNDAKLKKEREERAQDAANTFIGNCAQQSSIIIQNTSCSQTLANRRQSEKNPIHRRSVSHTQEENTFNNPVKTKIDKKKKELEKQSSKEEKHKKSNWFKEIFKHSNNSSSKEINRKASQQMSNNVSQDASIDSQRMDSNAQMSSSTKDLSKFSRNHQNIHNSHSQSSKTLDVAALQLGAISEKQSHHHLAQTPSAKIPNHTVSNFADLVKTNSDQTSGHPKSQLFPTPPSTISFDMRKNSVPHHHNSDQQVAASQQQLQQHIPTVIKNPEKIADRLVDKIQEFWKKNHSLMDRKGKFKEANLPIVVQKLEEFDKYFRQLKCLLKFEPSQDEILAFQGNYQEALDALKQAFFLNIFNFLVLYQIALLMTSNPEAVEKLNSLNMWQSFLDNTYITINGSKIKALCIMQVILRGNLPPIEDNSEFTLTSTLPNLQQFLSSSQSTKSTITQGILNQNGERMSGQVVENMGDMIIKKPHPLIGFGFFFPLEGVPILQKYSAKNLANNLITSTQEYLGRKMSIKDDYYSLVLPVIVRWYRQDFSDAVQTTEKMTLPQLRLTYLVNIMKGLNKHVYEPYLRNHPEQMNPIQNLIQKYESILKVCPETCNDYLVQFQPEKWQFRPTEMLQVIFPSYRETATLNLRSREGPRENV